MKGVAPFPRNHVDADATRGNLRRKGVRLIADLRHHAVVVIDADDARIAEVGIHRHPIDLERDVSRFGAVHLKGLLLHALGAAHVRFARRRPGDQLPDREHVTTRGNGVEHLAADH
jgi:hypothetical protein